MKHTAVQIAQVKGLPFIETVVIPDPRTICREARPFEKARAFARSLKLSGSKDWSTYSSSGERPADIPSNPEEWYASSWAGWPDWLGYVGYLVRGHARPFAKARKFVRALGFKSQYEWFAYCKSGQKPTDIPASPTIYDEWNGYPDWLGYRSFLAVPRSFKQARAFVRKQGFKHWGDFRAWRERPHDIPSRPDQAYKQEWAGFGDFIGTFAVRLQLPELLARLVNLARENGGALPKRGRWNKPKPTSQPKLHRLFLRTFRHEGTQTHGKWVLRSSR